MHLPIILGSSILLTVSALNNDTIEESLHRNAAIQAQLLTQKVHGVHKMTPDEGEKFFLDYWHFADTSSANTTTPTDQSSGSTEKEQTDLQPRVNTYSPAVPQTPQGRSPLSSIFRRDFQCPGDTHACTAINRPGSCCGAGETCQLVADTGSGDVGCCPQGQSCSGSVGSCQAGYTQCAAAFGGGCCIPGYECVTGGCMSSLLIFSSGDCVHLKLLTKIGARVYTVTITMHSTVVTSTITATTPTSNPTSATSTTSTTSRTSTTTSTSTGDLVPPARPTSLSTATTSQTAGDICPIGFYACSAVYHGGCCRTGRDCDTTSCPTTSSTTMTTDGRTIVVPAETTAPPVGMGSGRCASGWFSCADTVGGGCCPTGYACGSSCTAVATATATGTVAKEAPGNSGSRMSPTGVVGILVIAMVMSLLM